MDLTHVTANLNTKLIEPYQPDGVRWMLRRETERLTLFEENMPLGGIIADEVGLGKTILSIATMLGNYKKKTLIILPKSLICQWASQIELFTSKLKVHVIRRSSDKLLDLDADDGVAHVYIVSQSLLNLRNSVVGSSLVHNIYWDRVFIDEAHMLRNSKSKLYEACGMLKTDIRWALTATPVMNRMSDFINIMAWIGVSKFLCQGEKDAITKHFLLRRTKDDVIAENKMNECVVQVKYVPFMSLDEADFYMKIFNQERKMLMTSSNTRTTDLLEHLLRVRQLCIHPQLYLDGMSRKKGESFGNWTTETTKMKALLSCLKEQPVDDKTLIFCQFVREMDIYETRLKSMGMHCVRLDGTMNLTERQNAVNTFTHDPNTTVFIIQINTGGQGINLQMANRIYIMSPNWNPAIEYQAIGRSHRTGQTKTVYVTKFCINSGDDALPFIEENILKLQERKKEIISNILNDTRIVNDGVVHDKLFCEKAGGITAAEIRALFNVHQQKA